MWRLLAVGFMGLAIWGVNALLPASRDEEQLRSLTSIATQGSDSTAAMPERKYALAGASDAKHLTSGTPAGALAPSDPATAIARAAVLQSLAAADAAGTEPVQVKPNPPAVTATSAQQPKKLALDVPAVAVAEDGADLIQSKLVTKLQTQLRRVGCYRGAMDGNWSATTRRAMARFNDRINAQIDLDSVRPALLTLVETYGNRACGQACLPGTAPNAAGVCVTAQSVAAAVPLPALAPAVSPVVGVNVAALGTSKPASQPAPARTSASAVVAVAAPPPAAPVPAAPTIIASRSAATAAQQRAEQTVNLGSTALTASNAWTPSVEVAASKPAAKPQTTVAANVPAALQSKSATWAPVTVIAVVAPPPVVVAQVAAPAPAVIAPRPARTTIASLAPARAKKRIARKSSGWGNAQYAFGASDVAPALAPRRTHRRSSSTWADAFYSGSIVLSKRFVGGGTPRWGNNSGDGLSIVTSRH